MKSLTHILQGVAIQQLIGADGAMTSLSAISDVLVNTITIDSRVVLAGGLFIAIKGTATDGHDYIQNCIEKGVSVIVCEVLPSSYAAGVVYLQVVNASIAAGHIAANYYDRPSEQLKLVGVTGTNGKTSTVTLLFRLFQTLGFKVGMLSTVQNQVNDTIIPSTHTTPDAIHLNQLLAQMVAAGCTHCFMEVSSHAIDQERIAGVSFIGAVFTNITHDHLDYHKTFDNYLKAKKKFFDELHKDAFALTNIDDRNGEVMLQNTTAKKKSYSLRQQADFKAKITDNNIIGLHLDINGSELFTRLIGEFNAYNLLAVYAVATLLDIDKMDCLTALSSLAPPEGRFDQIVSKNDKIVGIVDYAHTPDALKNVLQTIHAVRKENQAVISIVGCGGDRDSAKRPLMAKVAAHYSDKCILTSDNPRSEEPSAIIEQMYKGIKVTERARVLSITDRREAIKTACMLAAKGDIILLAGKGHEKYQEIKGVKHTFDDKAVLQETFTTLHR